MSKIILSYTRISNYLISPHSYINHLLNIKQPESEYMNAGKVAHQLIQNHCLGKCKDARLGDIWDFTDAEIHARMPYNDRFILHGFLDMVNYKSKVFAEIKTSTTPWGQSKFDELMQWRYYAWVSGLRKVYFITCTSQLTGLKTYYREVTDADIQLAKDWATKAITGIETGKFKEDLDDNGNCQNIRCPYGENCYFKL